MKIELVKAEYIWKQLTGLVNTDGFLSTEALEFVALPMPEGGWLKYCREAQLVGIEQAAESLGMTKQGVRKLETSEASEAITLERFRQMVEALDCELIYFVRPRQKTAFSSVLWRKILPKALKAYRRRSSFRRSQNINPAALARIAQELFRDPAVRREMRWVRNRDS